MAASVADDGGLEGWRALFAWSRTAGRPVSASAAAAVVGISAVDAHGPSSLAGGRAAAASSALHVAGVGSVARPLACSAAIAISGRFSLGLFPAELGAADWYDFNLAAADHLTEFDEVVNLCFLQYAVNGDFVARVFKLVALYHHGALGD